MVPPPKRHVTVRVSLLWHQGIPNIWGSPKNLSKECHSGFPRGAEAYSRSPGRGTPVAGEREGHQVGTTRQKRVAIRGSTRAARGRSRTRVAELPGSRAACRNHRAQAGSGLTICVGSELRCSNMSGSEGGRQREGSRDSGPLGSGVSFG